MTKHSIGLLSGYGIVLILLLYFGLNTLIVSAVGDTFPNAKFLTVLAIILIVAWSIGLGVRRYLERFTNDRKNELKRSFLGISLLSWIIVLILLTVT